MTSQALLYTALTPEGPGPSSKQQCKALDAGPSGPCSQGTKDSAQHTPPRIPSPAHQQPCSSLRTSLTQQQVDKSWRTVTAYTDPVHLSVDQQACLSLVSACISSVDLSHRITRGPQPWDAAHPSAGQHQSWDPLSLSLFHPLACSRLRISLIHQWADTSPKTMTALQTTHPTHLSEGQHKGLVSPAPHASRSTQASGHQEPRASRVRNQPHIQAIPYVPLWLTSGIPGSYRPTPGLASASQWNKTCPRTWLRILGSVLESWSVLGSLKAWLCPPVNQHYPWNASAFHNQPLHDSAWPTSDWQPLHRVATGNQPDQPDQGQPRLPSCPHQSAHHNNRNNTAHIGVTPEAYSSSDEREVCCWDTLDVSYKRPFLQNQEIHAIYQINWHKSNKIEK